VTVRRSALDSSFDKRRLRVVLAIFFVALVVPTGVLIQRVYAQLTAEAFYRQRDLADELAQRIATTVRAATDEEERRALADYRFIVVQGDERANFLQRSSLAAFPVTGPLPGLLGYFQIDANGVFSTPLLPVGADPTLYGIDAANAQLRRALEANLREWVTGPVVAAEQKGRDATAERDAGGQKRQDAPKPEKDAVVQAAFDRLSEPDREQRTAGGAAAANSLGRVADLKFDAKLASSRLVAEATDAALSKKNAAPPAPRAARKEKTAVPEALQAAPAQFAAHPVRTFDSELDPFQFGRLDGDRFALYRKVWLDGQRMIQGAVLDRRALLDGLVAAPFRETSLAQDGNVTIAYRGDVLARSGVTAPAERENLLLRTALPAPFGDVELIFSTADVRVGPGGRVVAWTAAILALVVCGGFAAAYRFSAAQIDLNRQQRDFVSAVSHELKTPLTSIRMYGEILQAGWASDEKKKTYYDYIFHESERLSRLIDNVLRLARLTRNGAALESKRITCAELASLVASKVASHVERNGFRIEWRRDLAADECALDLDPDSFVQIVINLVDNAVKFSAGAARKVVEIGTALDGDAVRFRVRDYGPGIAAEHLSRIFELFYRAENELTRETTGTGIGLALVRELTSAMGGSVTVRNADPGAEFTVTFPLAKG
jgi:signal transduction histidine kinase